MHNVMYDMRKTLTISVLFIYSFPLHVNEED